MTVSQGSHLKSTIMGILERLDEKQSESLLSIL